MVDKFCSPKGSCLFALMVALTLGLFACGGGGGGGGTSPSSNGGPGSGGSGGANSGVVINSSNAQNVAGVAMTVAGGSTTSAFNSVVGVETTAGTKPRLITRALEQVAAQASTAAGRPQTVVGAVETVNCSINGSVTVNLASDGKSGTLTFNACSEIAGETLNGTITFTGLINSPGTSDFQASFTMSITFTETGSPTLSMDGDFSITQTCSTTTNCTTTLAGSSLRLALGTSTLTLSSFTLSEAKTSTSITTTLNLTVLVASPNLNGSLSLVTTTPVFMLLGAQNPESGVVEVTGLNSKAKVTVLSSSPLATAAVRVEVDADNNGVYEFINTYSWAQISS